MAGKVDPALRDAERSAPRLLVVVARDRPELCEYLQRGLAGFEEIKVILDRRAAPSGDSPNPDLRKRQDLSEELKQRGFAMIHLW